MHRHLALALILVASPLFAQELVTPPEIVTRWQQIDPILTDSARLKATAAARSLAPHVVRGTLTEQNAAAAAEYHFESMDPLAAFSVIMMIMSNSTTADMRAMMEELRNLNQQKETVRDTLAQMKSRMATLGIAPPAPTATGSSPLITRQASYLQLTYAHAAAAPRVDVARLPASELQSYVASWQYKYDQLNQASTLEQTRLQMLMDRRAKVIEILSNVMKKTSSTSSEIISNLK